MAMRCACRLLAVVFVVAALCCGVALGSYSVDFSASDLTLSPRNGGVAVRLADCNIMGATWMPDLPTKSVSIAIPSNMDATGVRIVNVEYIDLPGTHKVALCEPPFMAGATRAQILTEKTAPAEAVTVPRGVYPGELVKVVGCGWMSDYHIAGVMVYPVQYDATTGTLRLYTRIEFELVMSPSGDDAPAIAVRSAAGEEAFASMAKSLVANPSAVKPATAVWGATQAMPVDAEYLIITDASFVSSFQPLADWKKAKGYTAQIKTTASIYSSYSGDGQYSDEPAKIRACILDYKNNHGTVWVLIGGDVDIVPTRMAWYFTDDSNTEYSPSDVYYADLQGTWDYDGDGDFGENVDGVGGGYPDMLADVFLARATVGTTTEVTTFVNKVMQYEGAPSKPALQTNYQLKVLLLGSNLDEDTIGADHMEYLSNNVIPSRFTETKLYETLGNLNAASTISALNAAQNVVDHFGHGFVVGPDAMYGSDFYDLTNSPRFTGFFTSCGCGVGSYDLDDGCVGEPFLISPTGGGFFIGSSRNAPYYGGGEIEGLTPAVIVDEFVSLYTNHKVRLAELYADTLATRAPITKDPEQGGGGSWERRAIGQMITFGDPETPIWVNTPSSMTVAVTPSTVSAGTTTSVTVNVKKSSTNVSGAKVCLWKGTEVYLVATTNTSGNATFNVSPTTDGTIKVTVTYLDNGVSTHGALLPYQSDITVGSGGGDEETVYPTSVTFTSGSTYSGSVSDTVSSNNVYHRVRSTTTGTRIADFYYTTTTTITNPTALTLTFEGRMSSSNTVVIYAYNYTTSSWTQLNSSSLGTTDATRGPYTISNPTQYVNSSTGEMRCRLYFTSGYTTKYIYVDLVKWVVTSEGGTPPDEETTYAADVNYFVGTSYSGSYTDTQSDNNVYHRSRTATVSGNQELELYYRSYTTLTDPTSLEFTFRGRVSSAGPVTMYMWNYVTGGWEQVYYNGSFSTTETPVTISVTSDPGRFVDPSNGQMTIDVRYTRTGTTLRYLYIDLLEWVTTE